MGNISSTWTNSEIEEYRCLGNGAFGTVYHVNYFWYKRQYAVKLVQLPTPEVGKMALKEAQTLKKVNDHENVIKIYAAELSYEGDFLIWMEYCDLGDLEHYRRKNKLSVDDIKCLMKQLCKAANFIHSKGVIHRDIKPANILLHTSWGGLARPSVKLADFGIGNFAESITYFQEKYFKTACGTPGYFAPEIIENKRYNKSADIFSMGVVLRVISDKAGESHRKRALAKLVKKMTMQNPRERPSGSQVEADLEKI